MKIQWLLLAVLIAGGGVLSFTLSGCGKQNQQAEAGAEEAKNKGREEPREKPAEEKKQEQPQPAPAAPADFRLPNDLGGKLALQVLAPPERLSDASKPAPRRRPPLKAVENPTLDLPEQVASLPRLADNALRRPFLPQMGSPEPLFGHEDSFGALPHSLSFPAMDRVKLVTPDIALPAELPRMAQPVLEKAAVVDPTLEESKTSILSATLPPREAQTPFQKLTLPDPFENHETGKLSGTPLPGVLPDGTVRPPVK